MLEKIKNSFGLRLNIEYGILIGFYWMLYCCTLSMASAFLVGRGFGTVGIGLLLATTYLVSIFLQQIVSAYVDKSNKFSVLDALIVLAAGLFIALILLIASKNSGFGTGLWFLVVGIIMTIILPLTNALNFSLEKTGEKMNFGIARSCGSLFFFVVSTFLGTLMTKISVNAAPVTALIICILFIADMVLMEVETKDFNIVSGHLDDPFADKADSSVFSIEGIIRLYKKYQSFFIVLAGIVGFYFGHVLLNNFFYQVVERVGGDAADTSGVLALQAIVELPAMIFFFKIKEYFSTKTLLGFAAICFFIKIFTTTVATSVGGIYVSVLFQAISFAIFVPASVHLVDEIMNKEDAVKGQAFVTIAMTLANFLSAILGGLLISIAGVTFALTIGTIVTGVGAIVAIFGLIRIK